MTCADCFHSCVCHTYNLENDVTMCKQFVARKNVLYGPELESFRHKLEVNRNRATDAERKCHSISDEMRKLEQEVELLRIIKQTLEMQSGMKFDI